MEKNFSLAQYFKSVIDKTSIALGIKKQLFEKIDRLAHKDVNILIVGGTGVGKSSTINALFKTADAKSTQQHAHVGTGPDPETKNLSEYKLAPNLTVWDSPGLGESTLADMAYTRGIIDILKKQDKEGHPLIDLVLVVFDGGSRDYGSTFKLLKTLIASIKDNKRIVVGINRIDMVKQGEGWDRGQNCPTPLLQPYIDQKVASVKKRIVADCGLEVTPIAYCAGRVDEGWGGTDPYQVAELLCHILDAVPEEKLLAVIEKTKQEVVERATPRQKEHIKKHSDGLFDSVIKGVVTAGISFFTGGLLGGCFITTAVCEYKGKPDDCHMLHSFRKFRDLWLAKQPDGKALIEEYYRVAPGLVEQIALSPRKDEIYENLYCNYLQPCYKHIKRKEFKETKALYIEMVHSLMREMSDKPSA